MCPLRGQSLESRLAAQRSVGRTIIAAPQKTGGDMGLFSRKILLSSNAPRHWPPVQVDKLDPENPGARAAAVVVALAEGFQQKGIAALPVAGMSYRMFPEGFVEVPLEIEEAGKRIAVFIYPEATPEAAAHYAGARQCLREKASVTAVYYCPNPILPSKPTSVFEPFDTRMFRGLAEEEGETVPGGESALWWATEDQPRFSPSPACASVTAAYTALDRIEPWLFMAFVNDLQLSERPPEGPVGLPDEQLVHPVQGPDGRPLFLCASAEKGISFAFPVSTTPVVYRDLFLKHYASFVEQFTTQLRQSGATALIEGDETPLGWWQFMKSVIEKEETGGGDIKVGVVVHE